MRNGIGFLVGDVGSLTQWVRQSIGRPDCLGARAALRPALRGARGMV